MSLLLGRDPSDTRIPWSEDDLQMYVVQEAKKLGYYVAADFNAGARNPGKAKAMGILAGTPDLRFYYTKGLIVWIELKTHHGSRSAAQLKHHAILDAAGHKVYTVSAQTPALAWRQVLSTITAFPDPIMLPVDKR